MTVRVRLARPWSSRDGAVAPGDPTRVRQPFATLGREGKTPLSAERLVLRLARPGDKYLADPLEPASRAQKLRKRKGSKEAKKKAAP